MPTSPLTQQQLDTLPCGNVDCDHTGHEELFLQGRCHPQGSVYVQYQRADGTLVVTCCECSAFVAQVLVARKDPTT